MVGSNLEQSISKRVLEALQAPLAEIVFGAVHNAIASGEAPAPEDQSGSKFSRPVKGGRCAKIWDTLDKVSREQGAAPSLEEIRRLAKRRHWNINTARIQYYRWRANSHAAN